MAHATDLVLNTRSRGRAAERKLCQRVTFAAALLLVPVVLGRRAWRQLHGMPAGARHGSLFAEARADASAIIPYAFMG